MQTVHTQSAVASHNTNILTFIAHVLIALCILHISSQVCHADNNKKDTSLQTEM